MTNSTFRKRVLMFTRYFAYIVLTLLFTAGVFTKADFVLPGIALPEDPALVGLEQFLLPTTAGEVYREAYNPVLPPQSGLVNYFKTEEPFSTGYHYIVSAPPGAYKAEGFLKLPTSFKVNPHSRFSAWMNNDVPYYFFGIYTAKGGIDVGICWQKTTEQLDGCWLTFCTVFPRDGSFYTHESGSPVIGLKANQILHMAVTQQNNGVLLELSIPDEDGKLVLLKETEFRIDNLALRADGKGTFFNREISLAQHELNYTNGAELIGAGWFDAKIHWANFSSKWDATTVSLMRTRWEPVSEKRVTFFEEHPYNGETVSFIYADRNRSAAGE